MDISMVGRPRGDVAKMSCGPVAESTAFEAEHARGLCTTSSIPDLALCLHRRYFCRAPGFCGLGFRRWHMGYYPDCTSSIFGGYLFTFAGSLRCYKPESCQQDQYNLRSSCPWFLDPVTACMCLL
jgi:hypothetical protein